MSFLKSGRLEDALFLKSDRLENACRELFGLVRPRVFTDPTAGNGASIKTARDMGIEAYGLDQHSGFNILKHRILDVVGKQSDFVLSHPRYHDVIVDTGNVRGRQPRPDDLARCASKDDFVNKLLVALANQRAATRAGGHYGMIIGDVLLGGRYCNYSGALTERMPKEELDAVLLKPRQHFPRDADFDLGKIKVYPDCTFYGGLTQEFVVLWKKAGRHLRNRSASTQEEGLGKEIDRLKTAVAQLNSGKKPRSKTKP
jgi:hypothetical protein